MGKINADTTCNYYLKDHLGSIRVVLNSTNTVISAQDYDAWGYPLENRSYESVSSVNQRYKFTGKERDNETSYDYFGARYYDSRVTNWTSIDPLFEKHYDITPYNYVLRSPIRLIDPDGRQVETIGGAVAVGIAIGATIVAGYAAYQISSRMIEAGPGTYILPTPIQVIEVVGESYDAIQWMIDNVLTVENTSKVENEQTNESEQQEKSKDESKVRTEENLEKTPKELVPGRLQKGPSWKEKMSDKTYGEILKIAKDKSNPLRVDAQKMKKLIEKAPKIIEKLKGSN